MNEYIYKKAMSLFNQETVSVGNENATDTTL